MRPFHNNLFPYPSLNVVTERTLYNFAATTNVPSWQVVNDDVMGGVSASSFGLTNGVAVFRGELSLENNGGFASVRSSPARQDLAGLDAFVVRARGDGRSYKVTVRTESGFDTPIYQCAFTTRRGEWEEHRLAFKDFVPMFRGRVLTDVPALDPAKVVSVGFLISDKQEGRSNWTWRGSRRQAASEHEHPRHRREWFRRECFVGDVKFAAACDRVVADGMRTMEEKLWVNTGGYYRNFLDEAGGRRSDHIFAYQLDGEWMARFAGTANVFPRERVDTVLRTVREKNVPHTRYGAVNLVNPDGSIMAYGGFPLAGFYEPYDFFTPELFMLSMTYLYAEEREFGLELGRRCQQNIALEQGMTWDSPNVVRGNTGERGFGNDYYQNMIMWAYPAALAGGDISAPLQKGALVDRVLQAAQAK